MTTIESSNQKILKTAAAVFQFLADLNNHKQLMPESIYNWTSTADECKFTIQNMAKLELKISERNPNTSILIIPNAETPFAIDLKWEIQDEGDSCFAKLIIHADLNPFIKMMAVGPLQKLVDFQVQRLVEATI